MKKLKPVFRILYWIFMIYILLIGEPLQFWREPLTEDQVINALPKGYLPSFYEQVDELGFYFLDRKIPVSWIIGKRTACFLRYNYKFAFWKSSDVDVYVVKEPHMSGQETLDNYSCLAHEIGHVIDFRNGNISRSKEFQEAVDLSIEMLEDDSIGFCSWCYITEQIIAEFSGINGNPLERIFRGKWGGYSELYADLFAYGFTLDLIPPPLRIFYQDYLPWYSQER